MTKRVSAEELERVFDEGEEDILDYCDLSTAVVVRNEEAVKRVNVDFPEWMVEELDQEAGRLAINRQAVIKTWIAGILDERRARAA